MESRNLETLSNGLGALGLGLDEARLARLAGYHDFLMETNRELNLTGHKDEAQSVVKNLLNALGPWRQVHPAKSSADVGSGSGLPGLVLAIALEMPAMTLIESKAKRCRFLSDAARRFAPGVEIIHSDINAVERRFQQVFVMGFGTLDKILSACSKRLANGGRILAYKGRRDVIEQELAACKGAGRGWQIVPFTVPGLEDDAQRHLCVYAQE